ncbi:hypothetical protein [Nonomuraea sp. NPDC050783]|uniref:hypothetical protein n=1 Tax=Nonomuraea sp. NPDC050783 TaxID=3154634 RepID=UPI003466EE9C
MPRQFVAFLGAYRGLGVLTPWVTFVLCFLFIFLGASNVETLRILGICALLGHRHGAPARVAAKSAAQVAPGPTRRGRSARSGLLRFALGGALAAAQW